MPRPTRPPHFDTANVLGRDFDQAYAAANAHVSVLSTHVGTPFTVEAGVVTRGKHEGEPVLLFKRDGKERARAYRCCWGHTTNCNRTYIDVYTSVQW